VNTSLHHTKHQSVSLGQLSTASLQGRQINYQLDGQVKVGVSVTYIISTLVHVTLLVSETVLFTFAFYVVLVFPFSAVQLLSVTAQTAGRGRVYATAVRLLGLVVW